MMQVWKAISAKLYWTPLVLVSHTLCWSMSVWTVTARCHMLRSFSFSHLFKYKNHLIFSASSYWLWFPRAIRFFKLQRILFKMHWIFRPQRSVDNKQLVFSLLTRESRTMKWWLFQKPPRNHISTKSQTLHSRRVTRCIFCCKYFPCHKLFYYYNYVLWLHIRDMLLRKGGKEKWLRSRSSPLYIKFLWCETFWLSFQRLFCRVCIVTRYSTLLLNLIRLALTDLQLATFSCRNWYELSLF